MIASLRARPLLAVAALVVAVALMNACGGNSRSYAVDLEDSDYDLPIMQLDADDMPFDGMEAIVTDTFDNEEWAEVFASQDPMLDQEQKEIQLDAQGRVLGHLALFGWDEPTRNLGKVIQIESHAAVYSDEEAASNAISRSACGLLIGDDRPLEAFEVPQVADESAGFFHETDIGTLGIAVDTVVCFRTGRLVHAVVHNGLDGTQDVDTTIALAERKLDYVDAAFDGSDPPPRDNS